MASLLSLLSSFVNATDPRPTVVYTASQGRASGPPPRGWAGATSITGMQGEHTSEVWVLGASRWCEGVWLWCAHPIEPWSADHYVIPTARDQQARKVSREHLRSLRSEYAMQHPGEDGPFQRDATGYTE